MKQNKDQISLSVEFTGIFCLQSDTKMVCNIILYYITRNILMIIKTSIGHDYKKIQIGNILNIEILSNLTLKTA